MCNGDCRTYDRTIATCDRAGFSLDGRTYHRCETESAEIGGGHNGPHETICAALGGDHGYLARDLRDCLR